MTPIEIALLILLFLAIIAAIGTFVERENEIQELFLQRANREFQEYLDESFAQRDAKIDETNKRIDHLYSSTKHLISSGKHTVNAIKSIIKTKQANLVATKPKRVKRPRKAKGGRRGKP